MEEVNKINENSKEGYLRYFYGHILLPTRGPSPLIFNNIGLIEIKELINLIIVIDLNVHSTSY